MSQVFESITQITNLPLCLRGVNIDTDQILAAQFLSVTSRNGLGKAAFYHWRHDKYGEVIPDHILNITAKEDRRILVVDQNFGCGSSREHAPWALYDYGVRVILGEKIADIFKSNCLKNGIAAVDVTQGVTERIFADPEIPICFDLQRQELRLSDGFIHRFEVDALNRQCLMTGSDQLGIISGALEQIIKFEDRREFNIPIVH